MKRTSVALPDQLAALLDAERRRRDVSAATIIREAVERYLVAPTTRRVPRFAALGESGHTDTSAQIEEILEQEWGGEQGYRRLMFGDDDGSGGSTEPEEDDANSSNATSDHRAAVSRRSA
jgi:hypothetical protein